MTLTFEQCKNRLEILLAKSNVEGFKEGGKYIFKEDIDRDALLQSIMTLKTENHQTFSEYFEHKHWKKISSNLLGIWLQNLSRVQMLMNIIDDPETKSRLIERAFDCRTSQQLFEKFIDEVDLKTHQHLISDQAIVNAITNNKWPFMSSILGSPQKIGERINQHIIDMISDICGYDEDRIDALSDILICAKGRFTNSKFLEILASSRNIMHFTSNYPDAEHIDQITDSVVVEFVKSHHKHEGYEDILNRMHQDGRITTKTIALALAECGINIDDINQLLAITSTTIQDIEVTPEIIDKAIANFAVNNMLALGVDCKAYITSEHITHLIPKHLFTPISLSSLQQILDIAGDRASSLITTEHALAAIHQINSYFTATEQIKRDNTCTIKLVFKYIREEDYIKIITEDFFNKMLNNSDYSGSEYSDNVIFTLQQTIPYLITHHQDYAKNLITKQLLCYVYSRHQWEIDGVEQLMKLCIEAAGDNLDNVLPRKVLSYYIHLDETLPGSLKPLLDKCGTHTAADISKFINGDAIHDEQREVLREFCDTMIGVVAETTE